MDSELDRALLDAVLMVQEPGSGEPLDAWAPGFGWILKDGHATDASEAWLIARKRSLALRAPARRDH